MIDAVVRNKAKLTVVNLPVIVVIDSKEIIFMKQR